MIAQIELAILARLKAASDAGVLGYKYRTLETYPEEWDAYLKDKAAIRAPAAWAVFAGWRPDDGADSGQRRLIATFGLVVMAENLRGETQTRHGGPDQAAEPGSYRLAMDAAALLHGQDFDLPIDSFAIGAARIVRPFEALKERKASMIALELLTGFTLEASDFDPEADPWGSFKAFHANWDIPAFGGVDADPAAAGTQLPADDKADATDHVQLEGNDA